MLAIKETRKEIARFSIQTSPSPVAGYRLDNTVSITYLLSFWNYKQFLEVYKIILGLFEYIILKSLFQEQKESQYKKRNSEQYPGTANCTKKIIRTYALIILSNFLSNFDLLAPHKPSKYAILSKLMTGIEPVTPSLPRKCSTSEPHQHRVGLAVHIWICYQNLFVLSIPIF